MSSLPLSIPGRIAVAAALFASIGCGPGVQTARETIDPFLKAVQDENADALYCLLAGAASPTSPDDDEGARRARFTAMPQDCFDQIAGLAVVRKVGVFIHGLGELDATGASATARYRPRFRDNGSPNLLPNHIAAMQRRSV